jgi:phage-related protein
MADRDTYWAGSSYEDLMEFPDDAMNAAGFQLRKVQQNKERMIGSRCKASGQVCER